MRWPYVLLIKIESIGARRATSNPPARSHRPVLTRRSPNCHSAEISGRNNVSTRSNNAFLLWGDLRNSLLRVRLFHRIVAFLYLHLVLQSWEPDEGCGLTNLEIGITLQ